MNVEKKEGKPKGRQMAVIKLLSVVGILVGGWLGMLWLQTHGPVASKEEVAGVVPTVRVVQVSFRNQQLYVSTQGRVVPRVRTQAAAEVMGRVVQVASSFKAGGTFKKGEVMLEMDGSDYVAALASAESALADAKLSLEREEARAAQARRDWAKLGRGEASDLVLGKPQIVSAKARVAAAEAGVDKAGRDVERTKLRAPYDCLVEMTYTDLGSYVAPGARLADVYSTDAFEVRVPVTLEEFGFLDQGDAGVVGAEVELQAKIGGQLRSWSGRIVRSEGQVDRNTMTMNQVVAVLPSPGEAPFELPPSGLFVQARIKGRVMPGVAELPRSALTQDHTLLLLDKEERLKVVNVDVSRTMKTTVLVKAGIEEGDLVIVSPIETPVVGMKLQRVSP
ncbi:efflux RND transporter periplasmic adaptor subunit [Verrucomicrobiaceae bacterium N1E253]|uniref:Efflux RND transporter periplasmic adaptor subunit n=2 Tax=Oceaniferula marina TaxID=2748318 RepID=A0A851GIT7_9BACT|nr:efflux RND transporter periplasmic adaptor subunit [Oceaniferula marina]